MSVEEAKRVTVIHRVREKKITQKRAAEVLHLSLSRVKALCTAVREQGETGVIHGNVGRSPSNAVDGMTRQKVLQLYHARYEGFNFSHFRDKLVQEHEMVFSQPTIWRILTQGGVRSSQAQKTKKTGHRSRAPRQRAGELVQVDASGYDWFSCGSPCHLHGAIDDATGGILALVFDHQETTQAYWDIMFQMNARHGLPLELYADKRGVFFNNNAPEPTREEQLEGKRKAPTQFARSMEQVGIELIPAHSPQAKGRIEKLWRTLQDRLVKDMRLQGIQGFAQAHAWLPEYILSYNRRFARQAASSESAFLPPVPRSELEIVFCHQEERMLDHGLCFSYKGTFYVLPPGAGETPVRLQARQKVLVLDSKYFGVKVKVPGAHSSLVLTPTVLEKRPRTAHRTPASRPSHEQFSAWGRQGARMSPWRHSYKTLADGSIYD